MNDSQELGMKCQVQYDGEHNPPRITLFVTNAPHKRSHPTVIQQYTSCLRREFMRAAIPLPIEHPVDLIVTFIDPASPDLDHLHEALNMAMDGAILEDDGLIDKITFKGDGKTRGDSTFRRLYVHDVPRINGS